MSESADPSQSPAPRRFAAEEPKAKATGPAVRELVLVKNGQRYVFSCAAGEEAALLGRLGDLVRDPKVDLTWFDAAVLSHQLGVGLQSRLQGMQKPRV